jgi:hypothetical protein
MLRRIARWYVRDLALGSRQTAVRHAIAGKTPS